MGELTKEHREILILRYRADLEYKDIAEQLGIKLGTVMSRLTRAKDKLMEKIKETDENKSQYQARGREICWIYSITFTNL